MNNKTLPSIQMEEPEYDSTTADKVFDVMEDCPECEGTGKTFYSCCGDDLRGTDFEDIEMCPTCREHLGGPETCDTCSGSGKLMAEPKSISYEEAAAFGDPVALGEDKIPTSEGDKTIGQIMDCLMWGSYASNRDYGCSHELLVKNGIGNEAMRLRYESKKPA